jgi:hypothetical protein
MTPETTMRPTFPRPLRSTLAADAYVGPAYAPPYTGALQDAFAWHVIKYLREDAVLLSEVSLEGETVHGRALFTIDFVVDVEGPCGRRRIGFELGGTRTLRDHQRRLRRDAVLVATRTVDALYRIEGSDVLDRVDNALALVARWEAAASAGRDVEDVFSERGRINLDTLASPDARNLRLRPEQSAVLVTYPVASDDEAVGERQLWHTANDVEPYVLLRRFDARFPEAWAAHAAELAPPAPLRLRPTGS